MEAIWNFLSDQQNQATLAWLGGGVATAVSALWIAFKYFTANKTGSKSSAEKPGAKPTVGQGVASSGDTLIEGGVHIQTHSAKAPRWAYAVGIAGLLLLGYAAFFGEGDCVVNSAKVGGNVSGTVTVVGGSGDVECD
ncbi:hypothetical protein [Hoeflea sp.]|uniref:hypothetical protein n=1 Tax=Hoeflea sp. TaxID=1940281 RepID=UPI003B025098